MGGRPRRVARRPWARLIVVDTSVRIDVLNRVDSPPATTCVGLIQDGRPAALTDIVFTEILQGLRSDDQAQTVEQHLRTFPILRLDSLEDFSLAADVYRTARGRGVTVRKTLDCLIAVACIRAGAPLLHADADFDRLAACTTLRICEG